MTIQQLHNLVRLKFEQISSSTLDAYLPEELDLYINDAVDKFINEQYIALQSAQNNQQSERIYESLRTLIVNNTVALTQSTMGVDVKKGDLPTDYRAYIGSRAKIGSEFVNTNKATLNEFYQFLSTVTDKPLHKDYIVALDSDNILITWEFDADEPTDLFINYVREPTPANFNTDTPVDLPSHTHTDIAAQTVNLMRLDLHIPQPTPEDEEDEE